ncbi:MAG: methyltransferase domain-containing protein [Gammaproteobacteria bacterium]|nr:methyltransferase domain-containing protein [Gammaproteobacteria bacterium]
MPDWELHYQSREITGQPPADVLMLNQHLLSGAGQALDYACGLGANGIWLANKGYHVSAWDSSKVAISKLSQYAEQNNLSIDAEVRDLEAVTVMQDKFDLVVVSFFLHRPTLNFISDMIKPGGLLFYQTFSGENNNGRGPSNPAFRLKRHELLEVYNNMELVFYREDNGLGDPCKGISDQVMFVAEKK